ncbi:hypothetical protein RclHR1_01330025 [Rhizophagus clarus]|uniref:Uncharacterized protein n=1 Tax=Rhizophagus clarus TaxID=94130 RepID=A0A2Z6QQ47_9GLOM|nr:hypothetical protein RclHR1_01330025 [Rhizophagus clarus]GES79875.1 hypothetical protein GLOIN_2v1536495 [Rhizophagus clarus]
MTYAQRFKIDEFLNRINYEKIYELPYGNKPLMVASHARNSTTTIPKLTGFSLLKWNVKLEAHRLGGIDESIIHSVTKLIWNLKLSISQRNQFITLANDANDINDRVLFINNTDTINRIIQIDSSQETNSPFESNFFNGSKFNDDNDNFNSLTLPLGFQYDSYHSYNQLFKLDQNI